jgi:hypothetical protein
VIEMIESVRPILAHGSGIDDMVMIGIAAFGFLLYSAFKGGRSEEGEGKDAPERCAYCGTRVRDAVRCEACGFRVRRGPAAHR